MYDLKDTTDMTREMGRTHDESDFKQFQGSSLRL